MVLALQTSSVTPLQKSLSNKQEPIVQQSNTTPSPANALNRWAKRDACTWSCERKGRAVEDTSSDDDYEDVIECRDEEPKTSTTRLARTKTSMITKELQALQNSIAKLLHTAESVPRPGKFHRKVQDTAVHSASRPASTQRTNNDGIAKELEALADGVAKLLRVKHNSRRQDTSIDTATIETPSNDAATSTSTDTFDLFLLYPARLQSTVVECIRAVAAAMPDGRLANDTTTTTPPATLIIRREEGPQGDMLSFIFAQDGDVGQVDTQNVEEADKAEEDRLGLETIVKKLGGI
jgi:hypothetical protein